MRKPVNMDSDGECPIWHDADGKYISYEEVTALLNATESLPRVLDEREVKTLCKATGLPKYMWDTEEGRMDLSRFAHEAALLAIIHRSDAAGSLQKQEKS